MTKTNEKSPIGRFLANPAAQSIVAALLCIVLGLLVGYIALLFINPAGATEAIVTILKNYFTYPSAAAAKKYLGNTLVKAAPLLMCALSIQFCYQTGLFNIGAAGQYVAGAGAALYCASATASLEHMPYRRCGSRRCVRSGSRFP